MPMFGPFGIRIALETAWPAAMATSDSEPEPTVALVRAEPSSAEALVVRAAPAEFRVVAETVALPPKGWLGYAPTPPAELAVAETEPVVLDAAALELAVPPAPAGPSLPAPDSEPSPPVELAVAVAEAVPLEAFALELAVPPAPPLPEKCKPVLIKLAAPAPPWPPTDVASADASPELIDVVAVDVAVPPLPPKVGVTIN